MKTYLGQVQNFTDDRLAALNYSKDSKLAPDVQTNGADLFRLSCFKTDAEFTHLLFNQSMHKSRWDFRPETDRPRFRASLGRRSGIHFDADCDGDCLDHRAICSTKTLGNAVT